MTLGTSYFAVCERVPGTKISIARYTFPGIARRVDEIMASFAPSRSLLKAYKQGDVRWRGYQQKYQAEQRQHLREHPEEFEGLLTRATVEDIVLLCYEAYDGPKTKCHRFLLYDMLKGLAAEQGRTIDFVGERSPHEEE